MKFKFEKLLKQQKGKKGGPKKKPQQASFMTQLATAVILFLMIGMLADHFLGDKKDENISLSELTTLVSENKVENILVKGEALEITLTAEPGAEAVEKKSKKEAGTALSQTLVNYGVSAEALQSLSIEIDDPTGFAYWAGQLLPFFLPFALLLFIVWFFLKQMKGSNSQALSFGNSKARLINPKDKNKRVTFKDVAGNANAKQELQEMVEFLKNPKKFIDMGAKIPKGVLMTGLPGTGKTMMARAVAGEAKVPFLYISGSEFEEMFVGVGASRVRDLFKMAKKMSPSIIFIDEIDAIGKKRGISGANAQHEQALNQILVEMDGFESDEKVILMAATNRSEILDPALLRPGRFDRQILVELPDRKNRLDILHIHAQKKPLAKETELQVLADRTAGFSGADLESIMNESAIIAAMAKRKKITQDDLINAFEKVMMGPKRKSHLASAHEKRITAYHEAGHAIVASVLPDADPVHKVTIIPRGRAGGFTMKLPLDERRLPTRAVYHDDIAMGLGGYAAEMKMFGDITTGPSNDLKVATATARDMVTKFGMSDAIGPVVVTGERAKTLFGGEVSSSQRSDVLLEKIDTEIKSIVSNGLKRAEVVI
ncbi:MAG: ATP-dependent zinc metalloprotease FtsH, partial [Minisyncoccia bacterium]